MKQSIYLFLISLAILITSQGFSYFGNRCVPGECLEEAATVYTSINSLTDKKILSLDPYHPTVILKDNLIAVEIDPTAVSVVYQIYQEGANHPYPVAGMHVKPERWGKWSWLDLSKVQFMEAKLYSLFVRFFDKNGEGRKEYKLELSNKIGIRYFSFYRTQPYTCDLIDCVPEVFIGRTGQSFISDKYEFQHRIFTPVRESDLLVIKPDPRIPYITVRIRYYQECYNDFSLQRDEHYDVQRWNEYLYLRFSETFIQQQDPNGCYDFRLRLWSSEDVTNEFKTIALKLGVFEE